MAFELAKEAVWIRKFILELGVVPSLGDPIPLYCDNNELLRKQRNHGLIKDPNTYSRDTSSLEKSFVGMM